MPKRTEERDSCPKPKKKEESPGGSFSVTLSSCQTGKSELGPLLLTYRGKKGQKGSPLNKTKGVRRAE